MSDDLFGSLFEQGKQKKKDKIVAEKKSEKEKVKAEKAKAREKERKKAVAERSSINKKRKNNGEDINPKNKRQKTGSGNCDPIAFFKLYSKKLFKSIIILPGQYVTYILY
jgi:Flp pilus assembly protein TadB